MSAGWKEKPPSENQLCAPCTVLPKIKRTISIPENRRNKNTKIFVCFKNRKSIKEKMKKTEREIAIQTICRLKKSPAPSSDANDRIVTSPAARIGKTKKRSSQSILLKVFSTIFLLESY